MEEVIRGLVIRFREPDIDFICCFTVVVYITVSISLSFYVKKIELTSFSQTLSRPNLV